MSEAREKEDWKRYWAALTDIKMDAVVEHMERRADGLRTPVMTSRRPQAQYR